MVVGLPVVAVVGGSIKLGQAVRLSWWASLTLLGVAGYAVLKSPERRAVLGRSLWPVVRDAARRWPTLPLARRLAFSN